MQAVSCCVPMQLVSHTLWQQQQLLPFAEHDTYLELQLLNNANTLLMTCSTARSYCWYLLCMCRYVKFRQGEVWVAIRDEFEASGLRPTRPDRERLASGIELAERLAIAVRDAQAALLAKELGAAAQKEAALFEGMRAQRKLEQEARFYTVSPLSSMLCTLHQAATDGWCTHRLVTFMQCEVSITALT